MGLNDLDSRTIDLNLNVNLAIEILYQYKYVTQVYRLNYGTITACVRKGSVFRCNIKKEQEQDFNGNDVKWSLEYFKINLSYLDDTQFIQFIESLLK